MTKTTKDSPLAPLIYAGCLVLTTLIFNEHAYAQDLFIAPNASQDKEPKVSIDQENSPTPEEVDDIAACTGMILGERAITYVSSTHNRSTLEDLRAYYYAYYAAVVINQLDTTEIAFTDDILQSNNEMIINLSNAGTYGSNTQKRIMKCQHLLSAYVTVNADVIESNKDAWDPFITENLNGIERMLNTAIRN